MVDMKLPKPTTLKIEDQKYSVLLIPMDMEDLANQASNKGWIDSSTQGLTALATGSLQKISMRAEKSGRNF